MINFIDLPPFDIPEVLHSMVTPHGYEVEILPGGAIMGNGQRRSGIRVAVSWLSNRTGCHTSFEVEHTVHCQSRMVSIAPYGFKGDLPFVPWPQDYATMEEFHTIWRALNVDDILEEQKLSLGRYCLIDMLERWRVSIGRAAPDRRPQLLEDLMYWADEAMTALITEFPDEEHVFPLPLPEPIASFGLR